MQFGEPSIRLRYLFSEDLMAIEFSKFFCWITKNIIRRRGKIMPSFTMYLSNELYTKLTKAAQSEKPNSVTPQKKAIAILEKELD